MESKSLDVKSIYKKIENYHKQNLDSLKLIEKRLKESKNPTIKDGLEDLGKTINDEKKFIESFEGFRQFFIQFIGPDRKPLPGYTNLVKFGQYVNKIGIEAGIVPDSKSNPKVIDTSQCIEKLSTSTEGFDALAGMTTEKQLMNAYYIYPFEYPALFKNKTKGILLYGVPGTGKTQLVLAATAELKNAIILAPKPGELRGSHEGDTEKAIELVFKCAAARLDADETKKQAILFFDEFDAIAAKSDSPLDARARGALLQSIDGVASDPRVSIIAATNFPERIDDAVNRRFNKKIFVDLPDKEARKFIIEKHIIENYNFPEYVLSYKEKYKKQKNIVEQKVIRKKALINALNNIKEYGMIDIKNVIKSMPMINEEFIDYLSIYTGPKHNNREVIKKTGRVDISEWPDNWPITEYGYSASDIDKIMSIAINTAAQNAISHQENKFLELEHENNTEIANYVYINEDKNYKSNIDVNDKSTHDLSEIKDKDKIVTFSISPSIIIDATKKYKVTYDPKVYVEMVNKL